MEFIPAIVLAGLILYYLYLGINIMYVDKEDEQDAIVIELYAQQFKWKLDTQVLIMFWVKN